MANKGLFNKGPLFDPFLKKWRRPLFGVSSVFTFVNNFDNGINSSILVDIIRWFWLFYWLTTFSFCLKV